MRITKEPEERRQEILDTALRLFGEKGYEKTTIGDIAKAMGVAQGLCYRYFPSKELLFDSVIDQYADILAGQLMESAGDSRLSLREFIKQMPAAAEEKNTEYYSLFHGPQNKKFHDQLSLRICEKLVPAAEKLLQEAQQNGEIQLEDLHSAAVFCVYGQLGILLDHTLKAEEKAERIRAFLLYALRI